MSTYRCAHCREPRVPDLQQLAEIVAGKHWWTAGNLEMVQADAVHRLLRAGICHRHAALIGDLLRAEILRELSFRAVPPGQVEVRRVAIEDPPFDEMNGSEFRRTLARVRHLVHRTELSAIVEHDRSARRVRVTFQLVSDAGQPGATISASIIRRTTSAELIRTMRDGERRRLERTG